MHGVRWRARREGEEIVMLLLTAFLRLGKWQAANSVPGMICLCNAATSSHSKDSDSSFQLKLVQLSGSQWLQLNLLD